MQIGPSGAITREDVYDERGRLLGRKYTAGGQVVSDVRYAHDDANREVARQEAHRQGRTSFYLYDQDSRITWAELDARPGAASKSSPWTPQVAAGFSGSWNAGAYARGYSYDSALEDRLETTLTDEASTGTGVGTMVPTFSSTLSGVDSYGFIGVVDGVSRTRDALGNTTQVQTSHGADGPRV